MKKDCIDALVLYFGYVESTCTAGVVVTRTGTRWRHAQRTIAQFMRDAWAVMEAQYPVRACCERARRENSSATYCNACGRRLATLHFTNDQFVEFLTQLNATMDGFSDVEDAFRARGWEFFHGLPAHRTVVEVFAVENMVRFPGHDITAYRRRRLGGGTRYAPVKLPFAWRTPETEA